MQSKTCKQCSKEFTIEDEDLAFYKNISPTIGEKTFEIPAPTLCPDCRQQRRLAWRNERNLYKRKCDLCNKDIVALYEQNSPFTVYCQECFWSDKWDPKNFGQDYDSSKSFIEQIKEIQKKAPRLPLLNTFSENSEYTNHASKNKDCYLVFASFDNERAMYCRKTRNSKDVMDCTTCFNGCELCYECFLIENCYSLNYSVNCKNCSNSSFLFDCVGCKDCYMSYGLRNKQFYFKNQQLSEEEYKKKIPNLGSRKIRDEERIRFREFTKDAVRQYARFTNVENSTGDDLINCSRCINCYDVEKAEDCKNFEHGEVLNWCVDCYGAGNPGEYLYEVHGILDGHNCAFSHGSYHSARVYYSDNCQNCQDIFGCVSMKKAQYCVLNKQYTKDDYEKKVAEIIENIQKSGEWGEFFPIGMSPFAYNETLAQEYFPLDEAGIKLIGANWREIHPELANVDTIVPHDDISAYLNSEEAEKLLSSAIKCSVTGVPFRIMPQEMTLYLREKIPVPTVHYDQRHAERQKNVNPRKLNNRQCMCEEVDHDHEGRCPIEFETTYGQDRKEKVYCESCYQKSVI